MVEKESTNIYGEDISIRQESYLKMLDIYQSIDKGISAIDELMIMHEIARLDFHRILEEERNGRKHRFLDGFRKGLEYGLKIIENRSKPIEEQKRKSVSYSYYF